MFETWDQRTKQITLTRNENYWGKPAKLKRLVIKKVDEFTTRKLLLEKGDAEQHDMGREPAGTLLVGLFRSGELVRLDLVVQHELQRGTRDFVIIDNEYAPLIDCL